MAIWHIFLYLPGKKTTHTHRQGVLWAPSRPFHLGLFNGAQSEILSLKQWGYFFLNVNATNLFLLGNGLILVFWFHILKCVVNYCLDYSTWPEIHLSGICTACRAAVIAEQHNNAVCGEWNTNPPILSLWEESVIFVVLMSKNYFPS